MAEAHPEAAQASGAPLKPGEKCGYSAVILRGNTITVLDWATAATTKATFVDSVTAAATRLTAVYGK